MEVPSVELRSVNWLPVPCLEHCSAAARVDEKDFFVKADIVKYYPHIGAGLLRNDRNEEIEFILSELELSGNKKQIQVGSRVGYDAMTSSKGLRATKLKIYS